MTPGILLGPIYEHLVDEYDRKLKTARELSKVSRAKRIAGAFKSMDYGNKTFNDDKSIYAYTRSAKNSKILVVLNFTAKPQTVTIADPSIAGDAIELFSAVKSEIKSGQSFALPAWGYQVYTY